MKNNKFKNLACILFIFLVAALIVSVVYFNKNNRLCGKLSTAEQELLTVEQELLNEQEESNELNKRVDDLVVSLQNESYKNNVMEETIDDLNHRLSVANTELSIANEKIKNMQNAGTLVCFTDEEVSYIAKTVWGEARGCTKIQQSAVVWCILNRLEDGYWGNTIKKVVTYEGQFHGYSNSFPVTDDIRELVEDVLLRWQMEKIGLRNVGRTLPEKFLFFHGDGTGFRNIFTTEAGEGERWGFDCWNPYE